MSKESDSESKPLTRGDLAKMLLIVAKKLHWNPSAFTMLAELLLEKD